MNPSRIAKLYRKMDRDLAANKRLIRKIKKRGCWLCRKVPADLRELEFHHLDPKTKRRPIAAMMSRTMAALVMEIRKCRLICRDEHTRHHAAKQIALVRRGGFL